jgi:hypothetical protein
MFINRTVPVQTLIQLKQDILDISETVLYHTRHLILEGCVDFNFVPEVHENSGADMTNPALLDDRSKPLVELIAKIPRLSYCAWKSDDHIPADVLKAIHNSGCRLQSRKVVFEASQRRAQSLHLLCEELFNTPLLGSSSLILACTIAFGQSIGHDSLDRANRLHLSLETGITYL